MHESRLSWSCSSDREHDGGRDLRALQLHHRGREGDPDLRVARGVVVHLQAGVGLLERVVLAPHPDVVHPQRQHGVERLARGLVRRDGAEGHRGVEGRGPAFNPVLTLRNNGPCPGWGASTTRSGDQPRPEDVALTRRATRKIRVGFTAAMMKLKGTESRPPSCSRSALQDQDKH